MSIERRKVWQVIHHIDSSGSGGTATRHVETISPDHHHEDGDYFDDEDEYHQLIEEEDEEHAEDEEDIISYDSEASNQGPLSTTPQPPMEATATLLRHPSSPMVLDLATAGTIGLREPPPFHVSSQQVQVASAPRLVYVKLSDSGSDHVITTTSSTGNRPTAEELSRLLAANSAADAQHSTAPVTAATGGPDEELTSLTWLQDKNLIQGINLTTTTSAAATATTAKSSHTNGSSAPSTTVTEHAVTITPNCDKTKQQPPPHPSPSNGLTPLLLNSNGTATIENGVGAMMTVASYLDLQHNSNPASTTPVHGSHHGAVAGKTIAISDLTSKILGSSTPLATNVSHLVPAKSPVPTAATTTPHVHKKYRREEHVKISKQQQQQQQQQQNLQSPPASHQSQTAQHALQLTPTNLSQNGSSPLASPYSERSMSARKYSEESISYHQSPRSGSKHGAGKQKHPVNVPYNPMVHTANKPPLSFSSLIFMAIENAAEKALPVKEIYAWIVKHFPYFKTAPTGWKNSVRHNLSLNKCFQKVEKAPHMGKGSLWRVEMQYRQVLMQALTRSPYHQLAGALERTEDSFNPDTNNNLLMCNSSPSASTISSTSSSLSTSPTGLEPHHQSHHSSSSSSGSSQQFSPSGIKTSNGRPFDPVLFPYLSKEFSKLDTNNNTNNTSNAMYANNHFQMGMVDSESDSTGFYENSVDGDSGHGYQMPRFNGGGNGYATNFAQYPYDNHADNNSTDNMDDVNAATAMLALKHGPKIFDEGIGNGHPIITSSPSEDHTYSAGNDNADEDGDIEEARKKAEGVDALLNLAGFASNTSSQLLMKRRASSDMLVGSLSNDSSLDNYNSSASVFSSPSPTKRSRTRYIQQAV